MTALLILSVVFTIAVGYFAVSEVDKFIENSKFSFDDHFHSMVAIAGNLAPLSDFIQRVKKNGDVVRQIENTQSVNALNGCSCFLCMTEDDTLNLTLSMYANRIFGIPHILALLNDLDHAFEFDYHGVPHINLQELSADQLFEFYSQSTNTDNRKES